MRTCGPGEGQGLDLILEKEDFDYIKAASPDGSGRFERNAGALNTLHDRFRGHEVEAHLEWQRFLEERTKPRAAAAD